MQKVCGLVLGAGTSAQYIGLGFVPDEVTLRKISAEVETLHWNRHFIRTATQAEGILWDGNDDEDYEVTVLTDGNGIEAYYGGDIVTTASANRIVAVSHPALIDTLGCDQKEKGNGVTGAAIAKITYDSGLYAHFDAPLDTTKARIGVGSRILVKPDSGGPLREFAITVLSNDGDAANDLTLNNAPATGLVRFISYKYDFGNLPAGYTMPMGIRINETSKFNASAVLYVLEAVQW